MEERAVCVDEARATVKLYRQLRRRLKREVKRAYRKHGSVRVAAKSLGMPRMTFHDWLTGKVTP